MLGRSLILAVALSATPAYAQVPAATPAKTYEPVMGQPGKDVVWVPTSEALAFKLLGMARVTAQDYVIDLGSGDGRIVIAAAKLGARALGIEYNADLVELSKRNAKEAGVEGRVQFVKADIFESDFSKATVITMFLLPDLNLRLRPTILGLKPGTRVVSNTFNMGDWEADATTTLDPSAGCENSWCMALLWIVPAQFAGRYETPQGELILEQAYQKITGRLRDATGKTAAVSGKITGEEATLSAAGKTLRGRKVNGRIEWRE